MNKDQRVKRDPQTGTWGFVLDLPSLGGKRRQARRRGFPTARAANEALHELLEASRAGLPTGQRGGLTVGDYLTDRWLPALTGRSLRPTTVDSYHRIVSNHLVPRLGEVRLAALDTAMVEVMLGDLATAGLSAKTRRNVLGVLTKALADAVRWRLIATSPAIGAERPRATQPVPKVWTSEQLSAFLHTVQADRLAALWRFLATTGCRRGEAAGSAGPTWTSAGAWPRSATSAPWPLAMWSRVRSRPRPGPGQSAWTPPPSPLSRTGGGLS